MHLKKAASRRQHLFITVAIAIFSVIPFALILSLVCQPLRRFVVKIKYRLVIYVRMYIAKIAVVFIASAVAVMLFLIVLIHCFSPILLSYI